MTTKLLFLLFTVPFYGLWRRWFGGCDFGLKILKTHRWIQVLVYILITTSVAYFITNQYIETVLQGHSSGYSLGHCLGHSLNIVSLLFSVVFSATTYIFFWSRGHGACYDEGRHNPPTPDIIKRYNERWYHYVCDWLIPKEHRYGFLYDFIYMGLRYTFPCIEIFILFYIPSFFGYDFHINYRFIIIGLLISPIYAFGWSLFELEPWIYNILKFISIPTNFGELFAGFTFGLFPLILP